MTLTEQINALKTELREFIAEAKELNKNWVVKNAQREIGNSGDFETETYIEDVKGFCVTNGWNIEERDERNFAFIARSRNISPAMAECLLVVVEGLEMIAFIQENQVTAHAYASNRDLSFNGRNAFDKLQQILNIWEASK
jgi:hypothetical protein